MHARKNLLVTTSLVVLISSLGHHSFGQEPRSSPVSAYGSDAVLCEGYSAFSSKWRIT